MVTEEQYLKNYEEIDTLTKLVRFKPGRLNEGKQHTLDIPTNLIFCRFAFLPQSSLSSHVHRFRILEDKDD